MSQERENPLPIGRYWVQLQTPEHARFNLWRMKPTVKIEYERIKDGWGFWIFRTSAPVHWLPENFGFPTHAAESIKSEADVLQVPEVETDPIANLSNAAERVGNKLFVGLVLVGIAYVLVNRRA